MTKKNYYFIYQGYLLVKVDIFTAFKSLAVD